MIRSFAIMFLLSLSVSLSAQNLVVNPGFEIFKKGFPRSGNSLATYGVEGWSQPTAGTADWYCTADDRTNPIAKEYRSNYFAGPILPYEGKSFVGINLQPEISEKASCEYITGSLRTPLEAGHTYTISFWLALGKYSTVYPSQIQIRFSNQKVFFNSYNRMNDSASVSFDLDTTIHWWQIRGEYVAQGGEIFFTVGSYPDKSPDISTAIPGRKISFSPFAYCYLDGFNVSDKNPTGPLSISAGQKLTFNNILFDTGKSSLLASSFSTLDQIVAAMKKQPNLKVTINGHTDSDGDPKTNQTLSEQRALSVKKYFVSKGIDSTRINTKGFGSSQPIGTDKSKNRRVEFVFAQ